ncbi:uncharacterized protein [Asterias amurensis]|uniref:uncharacterized protein n=1 Tax=Asterias amurensis TaxID=7602 RepID=UPI003AB1D291
MYPTAVADVLPLKAHQPASTGKPRAQVRQRKQLFPNMTDENCRPRKGRCENDAVDDELATSLQSHEQEVCFACKSYDLKKYRKSKSVRLLSDVWSTQWTVCSMDQVLFTNYFVLASLVVEN